jgi:hypothetical protein
MTVALGSPTEKGLDVSLASVASRRRSRVSDGRLRRKGIISLNPKALKNLTSNANWFGVDKPS